MQRKKQPQKKTFFLHAWLWMSTALRSLRVSKWISLSLTGGKSHSSQENAYKNSLCWFGNMTAGLSLSYRHDRQNNKNPKMSQRPLIKRALRFIEEWIRCKKQQQQKKKHNVTQLGLYFYTYAITKQKVWQSNTKQNKTAAWTYIKHRLYKIKSKHSTTVWSCITQMKDHKKNKRL